MACTLEELLARTAERGGSDLHLTAHAPPHIRIHGDLQCQGDLEPLSAERARQLVYSALADAQRERFETARELDVGLDVPGVGRVRCNVFRQRGAVAAAYRLIPGEVPDLDRLALPPAVAGFAGLAQGLVLVTGSTGSGKSTTLAALIDRVNRDRRGHILTIEDPIEYVHRSRRSVVNQREVHADTLGFAPALRAALREDPDVVLIGEMRDLETVEAALRIAETGHLTLATLHANSAVQAVTRIVDVFPPHRQAQVRTQLSLSLAGVVCQVLVPVAGGAGRACAAEVLVATPAIRNLIREDKLHQIYSALQAGQERLGMQTMSQALARLHAEDRITAEQALARSTRPDELRELLARDGRSPDGRPETRRRLHAGGR